MHTIAIVVPAYKILKDLTRYEIKLLEQINSIFKNRRLFFIVPKCLELDYKSYENFTTIAFADNYFHDKHTYSSLLTSKDFYSRFDEFEYMQIIQTDCWVFDDRLDEFVSKGLDYIGAPWMVNGFEGRPETELWKVGNGGFSLRKVQTFLSTIDQIHNSEKGKRTVFKNSGSGILKIIKNFGFRNNLRHYIKKAPGEDIFWAHYIPKVFSKDEFKIADPVTAAHYSFEVLPQFLFDDVTKGQLPMGCHNWMNNDPDFWAEHISV